MEACDAVGYLGPEFDTATLIVSPIFGDKIRIVSWKQERMFKPWLTTFDMTVTTA